jgi:hypothetical protein
MRRRFRKVQAPIVQPVAAVSDLDKLRGILEKAKAGFAEWGINGYYKKGDKENCFIKNGRVLVLGSGKDEDPYAEFVFDAEGNVVPGTAVIWNQGE